MVENDYPVPCGRISKPEGWTETPQVAADEEGSHTVHVIDCKIVRILNPGNSLNHTLPSV